MQNAYDLLGEIPIKSKVEREKEQAEKRATCRSDTCEGRARCKERFVVRAPDCGAGLSKSQLAPWEQVTGQELQLCHCLGPSFGKHMASA